MEGDGCGTMICSGSAISRLSRCSTVGGVDPDIFISRSNELVEQLHAVKLEKERLLNACRDDTIAQTQALIETIEAGPNLLEEFDGEGSMDLSFRYL